MENSDLEISKLMNVSHQEIISEVNQIATYYPHLIKVYEPFKPIYRKNSDWELSTKIKALPGMPNKTSNESPLERSARRSQKSVIDYILVNSFELFVTITFANKRHDTDQCKNRLKTWLKNQRYRNGKFKYLFVSEYHKDGALHFHGVLAGYSGRLKRSKNVKTGKEINSNGSAVYEFEEYKSGFTKVQYIGKSDDDKEKVAQYIAKYITKNMVSIFGKKRYWVSTNLKKPIREDNPAWFGDIEPDEIYENEYGRLFIYKNLWDKALNPKLEEIKNDKRL